MKKSEGYSFGFFFFYPKVLKTAALSETHVLEKNRLYFVTEVHFTDSGAPLQYCVNIEKEMLLTDI